MSAVWWMRLRSPFVKPDSIVSTTDYWQFNPGDDDRVAVFLDEVTSAADHLKSLLDRQTLISVVRDPATEIQKLHYSRERAMALLLVDEGPSPELDEVLRALEVRDPADTMASWVRARLSSAH